MLVCELAGGFNPFSANTKSVDEIYKNILGCKVQYPNQITKNEHAHELLKRVFVLDPDYRISISEIKKSPFFEVSGEIFFGG